MELKSRSAGASTKVAEQLSNDQAAYLAQETEQMANQGRSKAAAGIKDSIGINEGLEMLSNEIKCLHCNEHLSIPLTDIDHDPIECDCGSCVVGGNRYMPKRSGDLGGDFTEESYIITSTGMRMKLVNYLVKKEMYKKEILSLVAKKRKAKV